MLNKVLVMGRLTRDPELKQTNSGVSVVSFSIAVDRDFKDKQTGEKPTDFIDCVAWRSTADFVSKYLNKGRMVVVEGKLQVRDWMDKEGGKRKAYEVIADNVYFADSKKESGTPAPSFNHPVGEFVDITAELASGEDELPF
jgi:single-strand DNA-binding protein